MKEDIIGKTFKNLTVLGIDVETTKKKKCTYMFCKCNCGNIVSISEKSIINKKTNTCNPRCPNNYYYKVGEIINGLKIIELIHDKKKKYKVKCIKDEYEYIISESDLKRLRKCPVCCNKTCVKGINDVATTHPHLVKYFANIEDAYTHTHSSGKKCLMRCPDCGFEKWMTLNDLFYRGFSCNQCNDKISYPEKFVLNVFKQLNIKTKIQASHTYFKWLPCNKKYDFYLVDYDCIIETHGLQHYEDRFYKLEGTRTLKEEQENDKYKKELALKNGIEHYEELDCRRSDMEWIKNSIMKSDLPKILNFKEEDIDWAKCNEESLKSYIPLAWEYYDNNKNEMLLKDMAENFNVDPNTFRNWLKIGVDIGKCTYKSKMDRSYDEDGVGVRYDKSHNRWRADFYINGKGLNRYFLTKEEAVEQRIKWENGDFSESEKLMSTNKSGKTGVYYKKQKDKWVAKISINNKTRDKTFKTKEEAIQQRLEWEKERDELYAQQKASNENI